MLANEAACALGSNFEVSLWGGVGYGSLTGWIADGLTHSESRGLKILVYKVSRLNPRSPMVSRVHGTPCSKPVLNVSWSNQYKFPIYFSSQSATLNFLWFGGVLSPMHEAKKRRTWRMSELSPGYIPDPKP